MLTIIMTALIATIILLGGVIFLVVNTHRKRILRDLVECEVSIAKTIESDLEPLKWFGLIK